MAISQGLETPTTHGYRTFVYSCGMFNYLLKSSSFFLTVILYFVIKDSLPAPSMEAVVVKILPIASLIIFVLSTGISTKFSRGILLGLLVSGVGDYFMVYKETCFIQGVAAFAVAQVIYAVTFGFTPMKPFSLVFCILSASAMYFYLYPGLRGIFITLIALYNILIYYMVWRALSRCRFFEGDWTWGQLLCALGSISFIISDFVIGVDKFRHEVPHSNTVVMVTYYIAQFGITMAVTDYSMLKENVMKKTR
ncbi:lysoplasmalogenase TMEM86A-like [Glandiceps talaboti]